MLCRAHVIGNMQDTPLVEAQEFFLGHGSEFNEGSTKIKVGR